MIREETWLLIDQFLRETPEAMGRLPTLQKALDESKRQGRLLAQQSILLHILNDKFGTIPNNIIELIQTTNDLTQLEQWLDQALDGDTLTEINFSA